MVNKAKSEDEIGARILIAVVALALLLFGAWLGLGPWYTVYHQRMEGEAVLARAEYSKKVLVQDAMSRDEAASYLAKAEIKRAEGVAQANKIIGRSLEGNKEYLHYLWIHNLEEGNHDVIYVPTEAQIPIFEAGGRFQALDKPSPK